MRVEAATSAHAELLTALFDAAGSPCFCRFWHFEGTNNDWLARCAGAPADNRAEMASGLERDAPDAHGVVAIEGDAIVGWAKLSPAESVPKIYARRLYKNLPCFGGDRAGVYTLGCVLVHPLHRRRGVARALVAGAVAVAKASGARAIEAFPRRPAEAVRDEELWTGPVGAFTASGFVEVSDFAPYPVLRRELRA
ncbi:MAG TPA: GNAT family N-acetyltransferase [Byssovorax sp.]